MICNICIHKMRVDLSHVKSGVVSTTSQLDFMAGVHPKGAGLGCVLFGDGPVPTFPEGHYFEVCNLALSRTYATRPWEMKRSLGL